MKKDEICIFKSFYLYYPVKPILSIMQLLSIIPLRKLKFISLLIISILLHFPTSVRSQNTVTIGGESLNEKAVLKLVAPNGDQGFLLPAIEDKSLINPGPGEEGMVIYDKVLARLFFWNGTAWLPLGFNMQDDAYSITELTDVSETQPSNDQILEWKGSEWVPGSLTAPKVFYDNSFSGLGASDVQSAIDALSGSAGISQWTLDNENVYFNKENVGIGLTMPAAKLHIALDSLNTSTSKGLVIENNSRSSSPLYGSQLLLNGNGSSQKIGGYISVENGTSSKVGQGIIVKQEADQLAYGQNIQVSGTTNSLSAGSYITNSGTGTGDKYGFVTGVGGEDSKNAGLYTFVSGGSGTGVKSLINNTTGPSVGMYSEISSTTSTTSKGFHSKIIDGGEMVGFESEIVQDNDILQSFGLRSDIVNNASDAETYGLHSTLSGAGNGELFGLYSDVIGTGLGNKYGLWSQVYGGDGVKTGLYSKVVQQQDVESYGYYADVQNTGDSPSYGTYINMSGFGGGAKYGAYYLLQEETNTQLMGSQVLIQSNGIGQATGYRAEVFGDGQGNKFGFTTSIKSGDNSKTGFRSYIEQFELNSAKGFESVIVDNAQRPQGVTGTTGISLQVNSTNDAVHYGIVSIGDDMNRFDGSMRLGGNLLLNYWGISPSNSDNSYRLELIFSGVLNNPYVAGYFATTGEYYSISDRRLKTNITDLGSVLDKVNQLEPSSFQFKNNKEYTKTIGFIAQDVEQLFPELVDISAGSGYDDLQTLHYDGFGVLAIKAIQEQQVIIGEQASKIASLEERLSEIESLLNK